MTPFKDFLIGLMLAVFFVLSAFGIAAMLVGVGKAVE